MTNPDNIIRLHSRAGGRGSVYEANAPYQVYSTGMLNGTGTSPNTSPDMNIIVGGGDKPASPTNPHIAIGENPQGYKVMLDIVGTTLLQVTAPATNKRYTAVVVYANDLSETSTNASTTGSPAQNGVILVNGPAAASPRMPNDSEIRAAITDDGGTGTQAVYAIIAAPVIASTTTTITDTNRQHSYLNNNAVFSLSDIDSDSGSVKLGDLLLQWGSYTFRNATSSTDVTSTISFSQKFKLPPKVLISCDAWAAIRGLWTYSVGTDNFKCGIYHEQGASTDIRVNWLAIGKA